MKTALLVMLAMVVGCSHQQYVEVEVFRPTHSLQTIADQELTHLISIDCEYAHIKDLVEKVAEHEGLAVNWEYEPDGGCPVRLCCVDPIEALAAVLDFYDATIVQTNNKLTVRRKE